MRWIALLNALMLMTACTGAAPPRLRCDHAVPINAVIAVPPAEARSTDGSAVAQRRLWPPEPNLSIPFNANLVPFPRVEVQGDAP